LHRPQGLPVGRAPRRGASEHKSYPSPEVSFQLLRYAVRILEQYRKKTAKGLLPPIFPVVFYHGKARWEVSPHFRALFECPAEFEPYLPNFRYHLCDLSGWADEELRGTVVLQSALLLMKHIFRGAELRVKLPAILGLLGDLTQKRTGLEYLETFLRYLASATDAVDADTLQQALATALPGKGDTIMPTLAEKWFEDGHQQGMQQGQLKGEAAMLVRLLGLKFGALTPVHLACVNAADAATLLRWGERVLTAQTIDEVFEG